MAGNSRNLFKLVSMLLVAASLYSAFGSLRGGEVRFWISLCVTSLIGIAYLILFLDNEKELLKAKKDAEVPPIPDDNSKVNRFFLNNCPFPAIIIDEEGRLLKKTSGASEIFPEFREGEKLSDCPAAERLNYQPDEDQLLRDFEWSHYLVSKLTAPNTEEAGKSFTLLCFRDMRELDSLKDQAEDSRNYVAMLIIDCYDELFSKVSDSEKAQITMKIDKLFEGFIERHNGLLKKIDEDHYFAIISEKEIKALEEEKFSSVLDEAHKITVSGRFPVTVSMGIGRGGSSLRESEELARDALKMTQGRGGDQIAVKYSKNDSRYDFYGGQSERMENNSKVKTRIFSDNLMNLIVGSDRVLLMGHAFSDMDAVGAAAGLCGAVRAMGFEANVCVNEKTTLARPVIGRLRDRLPDEKELFISEDDALKRMTVNTLLVIVDTNNREKLDSKAVYANANNVVYIDHHRQVATCIDNAVISLLDPDASSASEMVTEVISYFSAAKALSCYFADALLAGITLDTKDFVMKTRTRTFEAAAYLKSLGADPVPVKKLFANPLEQDILRSRLIANAEIYRNCAITCLDKELPNIRIAASQAADQLLNTEGVKASFAIYSGGGAANISARSYGTQNGGTNVQLLMEKLGAAPGDGGGHLTAAGLSMKGVSTEELYSRLKKVLDEYYADVQSIDSRPKEELHDEPELTSEAAPSDNAAPSDDISHHSYSNNKE
ncbi:MAG: DHH family phosphoesterase [Oscillospiraceae bacterium]|nr:DHH family phosphoesterase [Oscillospiraceae bacterium]